jgi:predicted DNA-binding transcriptional regulator YafY
MRTATRPPLERIAAIDRAVRAGEYPNVRTIAGRLEVGRRTVLRDVEFMRERLGAPLAFDPARGGYHYTDPAYRLPYLTLSEGELLALFLAERVLQQHRGTPYAADLARAFKKVTAGLTDRVTIDLNHLGSLRSFRATAPDAVDPEVFRGLDAAVAGRRRVKVEYWTATRDEVTRREIDPYHLASVDGHWYAIAYCHLRREVRVFRASRVRSLRPTGETFEVPEGFSVEEYLGGALGVLRGDEGERHRVRLRFRGTAARFVREEIGHPSAVWEEKARGELELTLTLSHLREVEMWALSWVPEVEVLEPPELRDRVAAALTEAAALHTSGPTVKARGVTRHGGPPGANARGRQSRHKKGT